MTDRASRPLVPEQSTPDPVAPDQREPEHVDPVPTGSADAPTVPSGTIAGIQLAGRYRLRTRVGSDTAAGAEFWRAEDTILRRDVAVTVLRKLAPEPGALDTDDDPTGAARAGEMMVRALRSGSFEHSGCARLLDVIAPGTGGTPDDMLGAAVTEWVPGRSLAEVVAEGLIKPTAAARAVVPLAAAAEAAHRHGLVLGCDHPQRVRITPDGKAQLCFALPRPDVTPADDVRGLGAVLYTLLASRWPLSGSDAARAGLAASEHPDGQAPPAPSLERPGVPVELDTLTRGTLGPAGSPGHVHTAAAVHRLLSEVVKEDDQLALFPPAHDGVPSAPGDVWQDRGRSAAPPDPRRRRKLAVGLLVLATAVLVVVGYLSLQLGSVFSDTGGPPIIVQAEPDEPVGPSDDPVDVAPAGTGSVVAVAGVEVFAKSGDRDNAGRVSQVIDGNTRTGWRTVTYKQQLPTAKPGVGIMVSFATAVQLAELTIDSRSAGSVVEIRSAPSADASLEETQVISEATLGDDEETRVSLEGSQPVTHVLLWIKKLSGGGVEHSTQINEVEFRRAGD